ncbi:MAG: hypothetical protein DRN26_05490 [Thermoplasmata archaeon]|nr:MAG: hypothetical protein DRN26_05490 [Thermoplasmata archaeon]
MIELMSQMVKSTMLIGRYKTASYKACEAMYLFQAVFVQNSGSNILFCFRWNWSFPLNLLTTGKRGGKPDLSRQGAAQGPAQSPEATCCSSRNGRKIGLCESDDLPMTLAGRINFQLTGTASRPNERSGAPVSRARHRQAAGTSTASLPLQYGH